MSLGKKDIIKNISSKAHLNFSDSSAIFVKFISIIKKQKNIKFSNFGSFKTHATKPRIGRNPLTREEFVIPKINRLSFRASTKVRTILN